MIYEVILHLPKYQETSRQELEATRYQIDNDGRLVFYTVDDAIVALFDSGKWIGFIASNETINN